MRLLFTCSICSIFLRILFYYYVKVDYIGVENVAKACVNQNIPKLIVISSGAVTRKDSFAYKFTNIFGGILDYKLKGEESIRNIYSSNPTLSYAIVRPGGLADGPAVGAGSIELNQGDTISGEVNRADLAEAVAAAAISKTIPKDVTFEIYQADRKGPLEGKFSTLSGYERTGKNFDSSYEKMFSGLVPDAELKLK